MGVELLGDAYYHGELVKKPKIGDAKREICRDDIGRTNRLMLLAEGILVVITAAAAVLLWM